MATLASDGQVYGQHPQPPLEPIVAAASMAVNLINATTKADTSPWVLFCPFSRAALELAGTATAVINVQMYGSCADNQPAASDAGLALGSALTALGITFVTWPGVRWVKAVQTGDPTGGALSVNLSAVAP